MSNMASQEITSTQSPPGMLWIPGGTFLMGSEDFYPEEGPIHEVSVDGFWMDRCSLQTRNSRSSFKLPATLRSLSVL